jgi:hypothetical protein
MGIEKLPAVSGISRWLRTTTEPPLAWANCTPCQRSGGQLVVTEVGIASRLNQYRKSSSSMSIVPVAWRIIGFPTIGVEGAERVSVNAAEAGLTGAPRALTPNATASVQMRAFADIFRAGLLVVMSSAQPHGRTAHERGAGSGGEGEGEGESRAVGAAQQRPAFPGHPGRA